MATIKTEKLHKALLKKGFQAENGDHKYYTYYYHGKKTSVYTRISHGKTEIAEPLLTMMAHQTRLSKKDFAALANCPLSKEAYLEKLLQGGHIATEDFAL